MRTPARNVLQALSVLVYFLSVAQAHPRAPAHQHLQRRQNNPWGNPSNNPYLQSVYSTIPRTTTVLVTGQGPRPTSTYTPPAQETVPANSQNSNQNSNGNSQGGGTTSTTSTTSSTSSTSSYGSAPSGGGDNGGCQSSEKAVHFDGGSGGDWIWALDNIWGTGSTTSGKAQDVICVPLTPKVGGNIWIAGPNGVADGKGTRLEGFFAQEGVLDVNGNPAQDSIDISLVEGYSVPVQCTAMGVTVGGTTDLFTLKATCNTLENGNCRNLKGPTAKSYGDIDDFFKQGDDTRGDSYCTWNVCSGLTEANNPYIGGRYANPDDPNYSDVHCKVGTASPKGGSGST